MRLQNKPTTRKTLKINQQKSSEWTTRQQSMLYRMLKMKKKKTS